VLGGGRNGKMQLHDDATPLTARSISALAQSASVWQSRFLVRAALSGTTHGRAVRLTAPR